MPQSAASLERLPRIGITSGDPNGIGPEVALKAVTAQGTDLHWEPVLIGREDVWKATVTRLDLNVRCQTHEAETSFPDAVEIIEPADTSRFELAFGKMSADAGRVAMAAVGHAVDLCINGKIDAVVTAPINKQAIAQAGYEVPGHTEFLMEKTGVDDVLMIMSGGTLRVAVVTGHIPLSEVAAAIDTDTITSKALMLVESLRRDFAIDDPRVAVLGLNPHAGDGGVLGREEEQIVAPAIASLRHDRHNIAGPFPADGFFGSRQFEQFDGILAMYHDQGLVPFKALTFRKGVNVTAGLPIVRTSPDHGTAYDIAGTGVASESSMREALDTAAAIVLNRRLRVA